MGRQEDAEGLDIRDMLRSPEGKEGDHRLQRWERQDRGGEVANFNCLGNVHCAKLLDSLQ